MNVLIVFNRYEYRGGEDTYVDNLIKLLRDNGHTVKTFIKDSRDIKSTADKVKAAVGLFWNFKVERELGKLINSFKPDIAHFHNIYPLISPTAYYVCKRNNVKIVQTIHNYKFMCPKNSLFRKGKLCELCVGKSFYYPSILYGCYHGSRLASMAYSVAFWVHSALKTSRLIDIFIFPSPFTKRYYVSKNIVPESRSRLLSYFVNKEAPQTRRTPFSHFFLFLGRLSEEKGIKQLLSVFSKIPDVPLLVVGDGPLRASLQREYANNGNISFLPFAKRSSVFSYIEKSYAVIVPSLWFEVQPNVILEAISCGKPVIVPKNRNYPTWIPMDKVGLHYGADPDLKNAITSIYSGTKKFDRQTIMNEYSQKYTPTEHYAEIMKIYESILIP